MKTTVLLIFIAFSVNGQIIVNTSFWGIVYNKPHAIISERLDTFDKGEKISVIASGDNFYEVEYQGQRGYTLKYNIPNITIADTFDEFDIGLAALLVELKEGEERGRKMIKELVSKGYSESQAVMLLSGYIWIGMSKSDLEYSWGKPEDINRTINQHGTSEQWVYPSGKYVYLDNGEVTTIQD